MQLHLPHPPHFSREELWNALTHGIGVAAALVGGGVLVTMAVLFGSTAQIVGAAVYVGTLVLLFTASTLFHAIPHANAKRKLQIFDHCAIFLLIAGTYTPFMLVGLRGAWGWSLLSVVWALAVAGVVFKLFYTGRFERTSTAIYIAMGWLVIIAVVPLCRALPLTTLVLLFVGGLFYTLGTLFYLSKRIPYAHAIWHGFVLVGSVCHFIAVYTHVVGPRALEVVAR